jgi:hypothetical protein
MHNPIMTYIPYILFGVTELTVIGAAYWLYVKIREVKNDVFYDIRAAASTVTAQLSVVHEVIGTGHSETSNHLNNLEHKLEDSIAGAISSLNATDTKISQQLAAVTGTFETSHEELKAHVEDFTARTTKAVSEVGDSFKTHLGSTLTQFVRGNGTFNCSQCGHQVRKYSINKETSKLVCANCDPEGFEKQANLGRV